MSGGRVKAPWNTAGPQGRGYAAKGLDSAVATTLPQWGWVGFHPSPRGSNAAVRGVS